MSHTISMPTFAPLYRPGEEEVDVRWLSVTYDVDPQVARDVLPAELQLPSAPKAALWVGEFSNATFTNAGGSEARAPYLQAGVSLACEFASSPGAYAVETFVAGLNYGILGRELFGLPKKQVRQVELLEADGRLSWAIVSAADLRLLRGGSVGLHLEGTSVAEAHLAPPWFADHYTAKVIPSADGRGYDVKKLVRIPWTFSDTSVTQVGAAELDWSQSDSDPLYLLAEHPTGRFAYGTGVLKIGYGAYVADLDLPAPMGWEAWTQSEELG